MDSVEDKPKHKPSEKHALEEVLKSLQDLIRNEIVNDETAAPSRATESEQPRNAPTTAAGSDTLDTALDTLDHLITHQLLEATPPLEPTSEQGDHSVDISTEATATDPNLAEGVEEEIVLDDTSNPLDWEEEPLNDDLTTSDFNEPPVLTEAIDLDEPLKQSTTTETNDALTETSKPNVSVTAPTTHDEIYTLDAEDLSVTPKAPVNERFSLSDDDIPILNEVVSSISDEINSSEADFDTDKIRKIAVTVVAQINMELRQTEGRDLNPHMIDRIQQLLQEALEKNKKS